MARKPHVKKADVLSHKVKSKEIVEDSDDDDSDVDTRETKEEKENQEKPVPDSPKKEEEARAAKMKDKEEEERSGRREGECRLVTMLGQPRLLNLSCDYCTPDFRRDLTFLSLNITTT